MNTQHTPGPWEISSVEDADKRGYGTYSVYAANPPIDSGGKRIRICNEIGYPGSTMDARQKANAQLIAAAPDLLAALQQLLHDRATGCNCKSVKHICGENEVCTECKARLAIQKATAGE